METLAIDSVGSTAFVRFDRPERLNSVTATMVREMYVALDELSSDDSISVVVLTGNGTTFCPGADLRGQEEAVGQPTDLPDPMVYQSARLLHEMPQVTLAAVNGGCAGAGMAWALACDLRIAADSAKFATAFIDVGVPGELGLAWTLTHHLGGARARELYLLGGKFDATRAQEMGLVSRVIEASAFAEESRAIALELADRGTDVLRAIKANLLDAERLALNAAIEAETTRHQHFFTGDRQEATRARLARRGGSISTTTAP